MSTPEELEAAALDAERLKNDPVFQNAVIEARKSAVAELITADAADTNTNIRLRAEISATDRLATVLGNAILRKPRSAKPVA